MGGENMKNLINKVAVVTGGGSGIGKSTAIALANEGCDLALADINEEGMKETAEEIEKIGRKVSQHKINVADKLDMQRLVDEVIESHEHVHIVVNNAGITVSGDFIEQTMEDIEWILGINLWGVIYGCKLFIPYLQKEEESHIVNICSSSGIMPTPRLSTYTTSKFAVRGLSETLRIELAQFNIGVTTVHPGVIKTNIPHASRFKDMERQKQSIEMFEKRGHPPESVANKIIKAIKNNSHRILIGPEAYIIDILKRVFPVLSDKLIAMAYKKAMS